MRYVLLSDTHGQHDQLVGPYAVPDGDVLVHAGDLTARDSLGEQIRFLDWLASLWHPVKVFAAGNHDGQWEHNATPLRQAATERGLVYLEHEAATLRTTEGEVSVFGSPWTPQFYDWHFMYPRASERAQQLWEALPEGLDLLVTHGPPHGILDLVVREERVGCESLRDRLASMGCPPRLHVFGHIHEAAGVTRAGETLFVNAAVVDERYRVSRPPVVVEVATDGRVEVAGGTP